MMFYYNLNNFFFVNLLLLLYYSYFVITHSHILTVRIKLNKFVIYNNNDNNK